MSAYKELVRIGLETPSRYSDAHDRVRESIGKALRAAREHAGFTVEQLAQAINSQRSYFDRYRRDSDYWRQGWYIEGVETGNYVSSERYVRLVLRACGLPDDWAGPKGEST